MAKFMYSEISEDTGKSTLMFKVTCDVCGKQIDDGISMKDMQEIIKFPKDGGDFCCLECRQKYLKEHEREIAERNSTVEYLANKLLESKTKEDVEAIFDILREVNNGE